MSDELSARRWLAADAAYCASAGLLVLLLARPLAGLFGVPYELTLALGGATLTWALALALLRRVPRWRGVLAVVAAANSGAAIALAGAALLLAVALEVAAFAFVQIRLLRRDEAH